MSYSAGPAEALAVADGLLEAPQLAGYHLLPAVRGDLLSRLGRAAEARQEFALAASMTDNAAERALMLRRADQPASAR